MTSLSAVEAAPELAALLASLDPENGISIADSRRASSDSATFVLLDPATGTPICNVASATGGEALGGGV